MDFLRELFVGKEKEEEEVEEESYLKKLCGEDNELYDALAETLRINPRFQLTGRDLKNLKDEIADPENGLRKAISTREEAFDKAVLDAAVEGKDHADFIRKTSSELSQLYRELEDRGETYPPEKGRYRVYEIFKDRMDDCMEIAEVFYEKRLEAAEEEGGRFEF